MRRVILTALAAACLAATLTAQNDRMAPGPPHESLLVVGERPPTTFALPSATDGSMHDLEAADRPILLLFFRGVW